MENLTRSLVELKNASRVLSSLNTEEKNKALSILADHLWKERKSVLQINQGEVTGAIDSGLSPAMVDRLTLSERRWEGIINDLRKVTELPDPVGVILDEKILPNGLVVRRQRVPVGVLAVVYEARPNVTVDVVGLAIKSGNSIVLRGGKETLQTNRAIMRIIREGLKLTSIPPDAVLFIDNPDREILLQLIKRYDLIDMLIPRGGAGLHQFCIENSLIPVITGGIGICHLFVDETADQERSLEVIRNAKVQKPTVCNALDTILIHQKIADHFIPRVINFLRKDGVKFHLDDSALRIVPESENVLHAKEGDFDIEWLTLDLGIKIVRDMNEAIEHIQQHGTNHSDGILTSDPNNSTDFITRVDSAAVYINASTRFTDGSALGLGAEIAVSTQKLHARGPMALEELTSYKWIITGDYHFRA